jgi:phenylalanyl-tRNA synthetase beta chain
VGAGLHEVVAYALVAPVAVERFGGHDDADVEGEGRVQGRPIVVTNPLSSQHSVMRQELLGGLLDILAENQRRGRDGVAIFETGSGYGATEDGVVHGWWRLGFALTGPIAAPAWDRPTADWELGDAKGLLELLAGRLGLPAVTYAKLADDPRLHPGRAARVEAGDGLAGRVGELHPTLAEALDLRGARVIVGQVAIAGLSAGAPPVPVGRTPSRHPSVARDLAFVVADDRPAAEVAAAIRRHGGPLLGEVTLFDSYRGRPLPDDRRSLAYRLVFAAPDRTLTEPEVEAAVTAVTTGVGADVGGVLRT